jgi:hypothetical protein
MGCCCNSPRRYPVNPYFRLANFAGCCLRPGQARNDAPMRHFVRLTTRYYFIAASGPGRIDRKSLSIILGVHSGIGHDLARLSQTDQVHRRRIPRRSAYRHFSADSSFQIGVSREGAGWHRRYRLRRSTGAPSMGQFYYQNIKGSGSDSPYDCRTHRIPSY